MSSWTDFTAFAKAAKSTLSAAQKKIDAVLDIQEQKDGEGRHEGKEVGETNESGNVNEEAQESSTSTASLGKLQEDFFAAFGLSTGSPQETTKSPRSSRKKPAADTSDDGGSGKPGWKSYFGSLGGTSASKNEKETSADGEESFGDSADESKTETDYSHGRTPADLQEQQLFAGEEGSIGSSFDKVGDSPEHKAADHRRFATDDHDQQQLQLEESGGWCSEPLVVPDALTTITNFDNADFLTPADPSPFFNTDAHLSFVGEDDQDGAYGADLTTMGTPDTEHESFPETDSVFAPNAAASTTLIDFAEPFAANQSTKAIDAPSDVLESTWSADSAPKASTSSCATNDTEQSAESFVTVVQALSAFTNIPLSNATASEMESSSQSISTMDRNSSTVFMDSTITSSSSSQEKSVATIVDGDDEPPKLDPDDDGGDEEEDGKEISTEIDFDYLSTSQQQQRQRNVSEEATLCVANILTKVSSELEILSHDQRSNDLVDDADDRGLEMKSTMVGDDERRSSSGGEIRGIITTDIAESFVQLSRSESNNGNGESSGGGSGHSPTQPTTGGKSSGDGSADELLDDVEAATTCSDVEIISTPPYDTVSERSSRSGIVSRGTIDWSFHPPSKLYHLKDNGSRKKGHRRGGSDQSLASCESFPTGVSGPSAISRSASFSVQDYEKKINHLSETLDARERKLLDIAKENAQLADENEQLRNELQQLHSRISRDTNMDSVQRELSERLSNVERKCDSLTKERDGLKRKCDNLEKEVASRVTSQQLKEKEEQISELLAEGEKLSKQELKQSNAIKKLREKEKDLEKQVETMRSKMKDMEDLRHKLKDKDEQEIKYDEMVHELKTTVTKQEKTISKLRSELEDAKDKCTSYKTTLENCARDIAELNQEKAVKDAEVQRLVSKAAESKEGELQATLEEAQQQWQTERQTLLREVQCLRVSSTQEGDEFQRREQSLRWEVAQLHKKLQETEERNQELAESITTATKPLLRQLDSMQLSFRTQQTNWERVEKSLYDRINESERTASTAVEKEREAQIVATDMRTRFGQLEAQNASLVKEKNKLEMALTASQRDAESVEKLRTKYVEDLQSEKTLHQQALEALTKDKELIAAQLDYEKRQLKTQYEKVIADLTEKVDEKESLIVSLRHQVTTSQDVLQRSSNPSAASFSQPLFLRIATESPPLIPGDRPSRTPSIASFAMEEQHQSYDSWPNDAAGGGYATMLERLRSQLQRREGELAVIRDELRSIQQNRDSLAVQLISLSNSNCELEQKAQEFEQLREQYKELDEKYQGLLLLYGEQIERNEELQLDLQDVKEVYKEQLDALLQRPSP